MQRKAKPHWGAPWVLRAFFVLVGAVVGGGIGALFGGLPGLLIGAYIGFWVAIAKSS